MTRKLNVTLEGTLSFKPGVTLVSGKPGSGKTLAVLRFIRRLKGGRKALVIDTDGCGIYEQLVPGVSKNVACYLMINDQEDVDTALQVWPNVPILVIDSVSNMFFDGPVTAREWLQQLHTQAVKKGILVIATNNLRNWPIENLPDHTVVIAPLSAS